MGIKMDFPGLSDLVQVDDPKFRFTLGVLATNNFNQKMGLSMINLNTVHKKTTSNW